MELNLFTIFISGLLLSFTPCVLPILPIVQKTISNRKNKFISSIIYILSMSFVYACIGLSLSYFGQEFNLQNYIQNPIFNISLGILFILLSLTMFDFYELKSPYFIQNIITKVNQNADYDNYFGIALIGGTSALILSPCITAPLAGILVYVSTSGDPSYGFTALFLLGLGMGSPMILISLGLSQFVKSGSSISLTIKYLFGFLLLIVGVWFITNSFNIMAVKIGFYIVLIGFILIAMFSKNNHLVKGYLLAYLLYFIFLIFNSIYVWKWEVEHESIFEKISNLNELENATINSDKDLFILDFYATWCSPCIVMEKEIFSNKDIIEPLKNDYHFLQVDMTNTTDEHRELMNTFQVYGPPAVIVFNKKGEPINRVDGSVSKSDFINLFKEKD